MQVSIYKNDSGLYELTPLDGPFANRKVALAEGVIMRDGTYRAGRLRSVWGLPPSPTACLSMLRQSSHCLASDNDG